MTIKQILQKIYRKLFISKNSYQVKFEVLNMQDDKIWDNYHHSVYYFCDEVILCKGKLPNGSFDILGHDKTNTIDVPYDRRYITIDEIQKFLESYGMQVRKIENKPFKKIFGLIEF